MAAKSPAMSLHPRIEEALRILTSLGLPNAQLNERSALALLALCDIKPDTLWKDAANPLLGITPMMSWFRKHYQKDYAPNSRETVRRFTMHQFVEAGLALYNPDKPDRPVNSPGAVYQIAPDVLSLIRQYGTGNWDAALASFIQEKPALVAKYAKERNLVRIPAKYEGDKKLVLSPGAHSVLIKAIIEEFAPRFAPGSLLVYAGDTGGKWGYFDEKLLKQLGVEVDSHGKMPDVVLYSKDKNWLLLVESVTSHGPVDAKRHMELQELFAGCSAGLVYVTAFPTRHVMARYLSELAWESEVWLADSPTHLIHLNGDKFLGPYE